MMVLSNNMLLNYLDIKGKISVQGGSADKKVCESLV